METDRVPSDEFGSQYFRRALSQHFGLQAPWNWREYMKAERWVLEILDLFRGKDVPLSE
jgi:hypothetical protein